MKIQMNQVALALLLILFLPSAAIAVPLKWAEKVLIDSASGDASTSYGGLVISSDASQATATDAQALVFEDLLTDSVATYKIVFGTSFVVPYDYDPVTVSYRALGSFRLDDTEHDPGGAYVDALTEIFSGPLTKVCSKEFTDYWKEPSRRDVDTGLELVCHLGAGIYFLQSTLQVHAHATPGIGDGRNQSSAPDQAALSRDHSACSTRWACG